MYVIRENLSFNSLQKVEEVTTNKTGQNVFWMSDTTDSSTNADGEQVPSTAPTEPHNHTTAKSQSQESNGISAKNLRVHVTNLDYKVNNQILLEAFRANTNLHMYFEIYVFALL